jgi:hypothetical protein
MYFLKSKELTLNGILLFLTFNPVHQQSDLKIAMFRGRNRIKDKYHARLAWSLTSQG